MSITNESELRTVYGAPNKRSQQKVLGHLDQHCRRFIALSPFCVLSTAGAGGRVDVSPRGDVPGFVAVPDDRTLLIPDRPGNNQIDSLRNVVAQPHVGLLFLVPGMNETLRVKGTAEIVTDEDLLATLSVKGRSPVSILRVTVGEAFLHCAKALIRARLWDPASQIERGSFPTYGQVLADQIRGTDAADIDASLDEAARDRLY
jgi:PPOX class probable FMN-dependent enzyme